MSNRLPPCQPPDETMPEATCNVRCRLFCLTTSTHSATRYTQTLQSQAFIFPSLSYSQAFIAPAFFTTLWVSSTDDLISISAGLLPLKRFVSINANLICFVTGH